MKKQIFLFVILLTGISLVAENIKWIKLEKGLNWKIFNYKMERSPILNIYVLKIDPIFFSIQLQSAREKNHSPLSLEKWCRKYNLIAGINASMYLPDKLTSTGYMKNFNSMNNSRINKRFGAFIVFNPKKRQKRIVVIIDKTEPDWNRRINKFNTVIQNYRIINKEQKIVWRKNNNISSIAAFGIDRSGNILFILCSNKISTYSFAEIVLKLPLTIYNLTYLEGGHEASLFINHKKLQIGISGKLFNSQKEDLLFGMGKLPNIIGLRKK